MTTNESWNPHTEGAPRDPSLEGVGLRHGTRVAVRCRFDGTWVPGFEIADEDREHGRFRIRRRADQVLLPASFPADELQPGALAEHVAGAWIPLGGRR